MKSSSWLRGLCFLQPLALIWSHAILVAGEEPAPRPAPKPAADGASPAKAKLTIDEAYVHDKLAGVLHPTKIRFLPDGRVKLDFDLLAKSRDHVRIFNPPVSDDPKSPFRWTIRREETYSGTERKRGGLRWGNLRANRQSGQQESETVFFHHSHLVVAAAVETAAEDPEPDWARVPGAAGLAAVFFWKLATSLTVELS